MAIVYQDVLDTVRTSYERQKGDRKGAETAHLHAKGSMVLYALLGFQQRLSQTQAFDSVVFLECCREEDEEEASAFFELIRIGVFQVALLNQPSLLTAFRSKLQTIELSAWDGMDNPELHDEAR